MASIGNAALILSAAGGKLTSGLQSAGSEIKSWAGSAAGSVGSAFSGIGGKLAGFIKGGPHVAAIGMLAGTILGAISEPFDKLKELGGLQKKADVFGISASELQGFTKLFEKVGVDGESATHVFAIMGRNVGKLAEHGSKGAEALAKIGLSADDLQGKDLTTQFKLIADGISRLPKGGEQAAAAMSLFGKSGDQLLPMLQRGGKGIDDFLAKQKAVGAVLSDPQIKAAADAQKAWKESRDQIAATWDGLVNRATLIAAPIVKFLGGAFSKGFSLLTPVFDWLGRAIERVSIIAEAVFTVFSGWLEEAVNWVKSLAGEFGSWGADFPTVEEVVTEVLKAIALSLAVVWDSLKAGVGATSYVVSYIVEDFGYLVDAFKGTIKDLLEIAGELPDKLGGSFFREKAKDVDKWGAHIHDVANKMRTWGEDSMDGWGNSAAEVEEWFNKIKMTRDAIEKPLAAPGPDKKKFETPDYHAVGAFLQGSKEAYSIESEFRFKSLIDQDKKGIEQKQLDVLDDINRGIDSVKDILKGGVLLTAG